MKKRILSLALIAVLAMMLIPCAHASWTMYVSPAKGTTVNLRSTPAIVKGDKNVITKIPYGTALTVKYVSNGWACIDYGVGSYDEAYMMVKYLTYDYVAPTAANMTVNKNNADTSSKPASSSTSKSSSSSGSGDAATRFARMNEQFRSFRRIPNSFTVYVKPERATGWVNFRYAPDEKAELVRQVRLNEQLIVIGETARWYQAQDPNTGIIGYVSRFYVSTNPN
ncbi:MAG: SH3 domain-containing protein [Clostridia bacterium]|nr:SH3 domain-containing protein [Clostridia bacterium]